MSIVHCQLSILFFYLAKIKKKYYICAFTIEKYLYGYGTNVSLYMETQAIR